MGEQHETDIVIVGAGPVGLFQVFEAGMLDMRCHVVDTLDAIGGQCTALYPEKPIYDIPALPVVQAQELIGQLERQAAPFSPVYHLGQQVVGVDGHAGAFSVGTSAGTTIRCKAVVIAAGCGAFGPNRPPLAGIKTYENTGTVAYLVTRRRTTGASGWSSPAAAIPPSTGRSASTRSLRRSWSCTGAGGSGQRPKRFAGSTHWSTPAPSIW